MKIKLIYTFAVIAAAAFAVSAQKPTRSGELLISYDDIRAGMCSTTMPDVGRVGPGTPASAVLYNRTFRGQPDPDFCHPVLNPDGSPMTLGQYAAPTGRASVMCQRKGTQTVMHFSGLRPNGVYTIWIIAVDPMGPPLGVGELGRTGADENRFVATDEGEGSIAARTPEEDLSIFGHVGSCLLDAPLAFELVYHSDNQTHGGDPGPPSTWVTNAVFVLPQ